MASQFSKQPGSENLSEPLNLNGKRRGEKSGQCSNSELHSSSTADTDTQKRMRLNGSYSHELTFAQEGISARSLSNGTKRESPVYTVDGSDPETFIRLEGEKQFLKREIGSLTLKREHEDSIFREEIEDLKKQNFTLCREPHWYQANANRSRPSDGLERLRKEIEKRDVEIGEMNQQISSLEDQLNAEEGLSGILRDAQAHNHVSVNFSENMAQLEAAIGQAALVISQCLCGKQLSILQESPRNTPELSFIVRESLGRFTVVDSYPRQALFALLFSFTRKRVFYPGCWTDLQVEGRMLRGYQAVIQRITRRGTLEGLHGAALELMLEEGHPFREYWVQSQVEEVKSEFLCLLSPLFVGSKMKVFEEGVQATLTRAFTEAFYFRARCESQKGTRYDLIQFNAGDPFDPDFMLAEAPDGTIQSIPSEKSYRLKLCVHGCLISYVMNDESFDGELCSTTGRPFTSADEEGKSSENEQKKMLESGKAIIILNHDTQP